MATLRDITEAVKNRRNKDFKRITSRDEVRARYLARVQQQAALDAWIAANTPADTVEG